MKLKEGDRFKDLQVIKFLGSKNGNNVYLCKCSCEKTREVIYTHLVNNRVTSCGCKNFSSNSHGNRKYSPQESSFRAKASSYKGEANSRKIEFSLTKEQTVELLKQDCFYCGGKPMNRFNIRISHKSSKKNNYSAQHADEYWILYNGIDRVDNSKGYTTDNTVTCCSHCNTAKLTRTTEEFKNWIINIYNKFINL